VIKILDLFKKGCEIQDQERAVIEKEQQGKLRGGNTGYLVGDEVHGSCAREAVMRYFGVDKKFDTSRKVLFRSGELMEDLLLEKLTKAGVESLAQSEAGLEWDCNGIPVKISPDGVLVKDGVPYHGLEVKMPSSQWTVRNVTPFSYTCGSTPNASHLCQAAHYSCKLGEKYGEDYLPYSLVYVCPIQYQIYVKDIRDSVYQSEFLQRNAKGEVFKVLSFIVSYDLMFNQEGRLLYKLEDSENVHTTEITIDGINRYYEMLVDCVRKKIMPPRMINTDCKGNKLKWGRYDPTYNDYSDLHDRWDSGDISFDDFIREAKAKWKK